jgi:hypothetical protein
VEQSRVEIRLALGQDLAGGGPVVRRRRVIEGGHFGKRKVILLERVLLLGYLREPALRDQRISPR